MKKEMVEMCRIMRKQIDQTWGNGWRVLGEEIQRAVITERVFHLFAGRDGNNYSVKPAEMFEQLKTMLNFCGLDND